MGSKSTSKFLVKVNAIEKNSTEKLYIEQEIFHELNFYYSTRNSHDSLSLVCLMDLIESYFQKELAY